MWGYFSAKEEKHGIFADALNLIQPELRRCRSLP